jgi:hypothetical protein
VVDLRRTVFYILALFFVSLGYIVCEVIFEANIAKMKHFVPKLSRKAAFFCVSTKKISVHP